MAKSRVFGCSFMGKAAITPEGGIAVLLTNKTGAPTVKGTVVTMSSATDEAFTAQTNEYDAVGVVYEAGIPDGDLAWVVISGRAEVLMANSTNVTRGMLAICSPTDGRATAIANPGSGLPATDTHFKEIGHFLATVAGGTNVLAPLMLHFN